MTDPDDPTVPDLCVVPTLDDVPVSEQPAPDDPGGLPGSGTAATCWLCNHETGELCHIHDPEFVRMRAAREAGSK
jgi:hypothetical protein